MWQPRGRFNRQWSQAGDSLFALPLFTPRLRVSAWKCLLPFRRCQNQHCFRARVSPKPWRLNAKMALITPVAEHYLALRKEWVREYEAQSVGYASCRFLEEAGSGIVDPAARSVQKLHNELCRAESMLPLA